MLAACATAHGEIFDECGCADIPEGDCDCDGNQLKSALNLDAQAPSVSAAAATLRLMRPPPTTTPDAAHGICVQMMTQLRWRPSTTACLQRVQRSLRWFFEWRMHCNILVRFTSGCDCNGSQLTDALGVCGGDCTADADADGICDDVDDCVGELDACGVCNGPGEIFECGCADIPEGDCDCDGNQARRLGRVWRQTAQKMPCRWHLR